MVRVRGDDLGEFGAREFAAVRAAAANGPIGRAEQSGNSVGSLRSFQRAQSAGRRAGWDEASRALLREAVARGRVSVGDLAELAAVPHWIRRTLAVVFKLGDPDAGPPPRGEVAARIAATMRAFEAGNPLLRQLAAARCPCGAPDCAAQGTRERLATVTGLAAAALRGPGAHTPAGTP